MAGPVIQAGNLGKRYRLGQHEPYRTLRDAITKAVGGAFRALHPTSSRANHGARVPASAGYVWALKNVSFEVGEGEVVGVVGPNGAGKTTLLKVLSRITEPTEGWARIRGRVGSLLEVGTGFHPELTGAENIYLYGALLGMRKLEIDLKFDEIVAFSEIEKFIDTPVKRYSSGMYLRLAFAVAAHLETEVLLVDEVLAVGDIRFQRKCLGKMEDVAEAGRTVLFVSHNMAAIEQLCSRAMLISEGSLKKVGGVDSVIEFYLSSVDARFGAPAGVLATSPDGSVELLSLTPTDREGRPVQVVQCGRDLSLSVLLRAAMRLPGVSVTIGVNTMFGTRVALLHSAIAGQTFPLAPGTHAVVCRIPHLPLAPGSYILDLQMFSQDESLMWIPQAQRLMVESGDFYDTGKTPNPKWAGFFYLDQEWHVSTISR